MAKARYTRIDGRNSSGNWSAVAIIGFVCVCLVVGWMIASSSISPLQNARISFQQIVGSREDGNAHSEELQSLSGKAQEQQLSKDGSDGNDKVDQVDRDEKKSTSMTLEKSNNLVPDVNEKVAQNEEKKEGDYRTGDSPMTSVPIGSPVEVYGDELEKNATQKFQQDKMEKNTTREVPNPGMNFGGSETSKIPFGNETTNELGRDQLISPIPGQENVVAQSSEEAPKENGLPSSSKDNTDSQNTTSTKLNNWLIQSADSEKEKPISYNWKVCNTRAGPDYIPCLDNIRAIKKLPSTKHYEHRERHCPDEPPTCVVPIPERYGSLMYLILSWLNIRDVKIG